MMDNPFEFFSVSEIKCKCGCGGIVIDPSFLSVMNSIRSDFNRPIIINRWYSCTAHDKMLGGKGNHPTGLAADVRCLHSWTRQQLVSLAGKYGIERIGVASTFLHLDMVTGAPSPRMWLYT